jgi:hypothetical protein
MFCNGLTNYVRGPKKTVRLTSWWMGPTLRAIGRWRACMWPIGEASCHPTVIAAKVWNVKSCTTEVAIGTRQGAPSAKDRPPQGVEERKKPPCEMGDGFAMEQVLDIVALYSMAEFAWLGCFLEPPCSRQVVAQHPKAGEDKVVWQKATKC